ncbi:MAG TPA: hypothetical protein VK638_55125 [Edaphobacter sp.]|nr:hypothetical protein [Edaphobacter sp.]
MENLDGTIIPTALPQMASSFHVGAANLNIGMTAYPSPTSARRLTARPTPSTPPPAAS